MKSSFAGITRHQSEVDRQSKIQRIKSSLRSFPILSRNQTRIQKRLSENLDLHQEHHSSDNQSIENQQDLHPFFIDHIELFLEKYQLKEKIGEGSNGVVHRCIKKRTGQNYAVKSFMYDDEQLPELKANFLIMKSLSHPYIIKYEALYIDVQKHAGWLVMELINSPSLSKAHFSTQNQVRYMFRQVVQSLSYLHKRGIAHRDIKLQNILFNPEAKTIKIIDFGICRKYRKKGIKVEMWTITGTLYYRAPQMLIGGGYTQKTDIWASGVLLYKVITGKTPFESAYHQDTMTNILHKDLDCSPIFDGYSSSLFELIKKMINRNPKERLTAQQCLKQSWFTQNTTQRELNHNIEQDSEGLSPIEPKFRRFKEYIKEINGDQYHCIDSDEQHEKKAKAGKHKKLITLSQVNFLI